MRSRWKLLVEGLGRIRRAEVEVHPLMLFVGQNNTGKSYLATLMWGLLTQHGAVFPDPNNLALERKEFAVLDHWLRARFSEEAEGATYAFTPEGELRFFSMVQ